MRKKKTKRHAACVSDKRNSTKQILNKNEAINIKRGLWARIEINRFIITLMQCFGVQTIFVQLNSDYCKFIVIAIGLGLIN